MSAPSEGGHGRQEWKDWIDRARAADLLTTAESLGASLKKVAATEFVGPCPLCGGHDRFSVNTRKRVFNCRGSGDGGDVIAMVQHLGDYDFLGACERINGEPRPDHSRDETPEERESRLRSNAARMAALEHRRKEERKAEEARAKRDEEAVADILERAKPIEGTHAEAYMREGRGLIPRKRFTQDLRFVAALDYWGAGDNGSGKLIKLAVLPALVAIIRAFDGAIIGISQTYLDPKEPTKWTPIGSPNNSPKKIKGDKRGGMIRLGPLEETMAIAEGWENALAWHQLGHGDHIGNVSLAAAVDLGNLCGRATATVQHPTEFDPSGRPRRMPHGENPDPSNPGVVLPEGVRTVILLADNDSEIFMTAAKMCVATRRFLDTGLKVALHWAPKGLDWNNALLEQGGR
jgi:hypothetical protein